MLFARRLNRILLIIRRVSPGVISRKKTKKRTNESGDDDPEGQGRSILERVREEEKRWAQGHNRKNTGERSILKDRSTSFTEKI